MGIEHRNIPYTQISRAVAYVVIGAAIAIVWCSSHSKTPSPFPTQPWQYPESYLSTTLSLAEELHSAAWDCEGECVEDFVELAVVLQREATAAGLDVALLKGVLLVENPWFKLDAESYAGALGLMQVMPFHVFEECEAKGGLRSLEGNVCAGVKVLGMYLKRAERSALLRYNGCVWQDHPCQDYPEKVYARQ